MNILIRVAAMSPLAFALVACAEDAPAPAAAPASARATAAVATEAVSEAPAARAAASPAAVDAALPRVLVHKSPTCGCCAGWVKHMEASGFAVEVVETHDLEPVRKDVGVPVGKASCHTAQVDGYFVEGHVPADDVKRLLAERPDARGLTAPGMPIGSPGMEVPSGATPGYAVLLVADDGTTSEFARHGDE